MVTRNDLDKEGVNGTPQAILLNSKISHHQIHVDLTFDNDMTRRIQLYIYVARRGSAPSISPCFKHEFLKKIHTHTHTYYINIYGWSTTFPLTLYIWSERNSCCFSLFCKDVFNEMLRTMKKVTNQHKL